MHKTLIIADDVQLFDSSGLNVITFDDYLANFPKLNEPKTRVINLCDTSEYLSRGYYCSLLAQARKHRVLPAVNTINDMRMTADSHMPPRVTLPDTLQSTDITVLPASFFVIFGKTEEPALAMVAHRAFALYPCPIMQLTLHVASESGATIGYAECRVVGFNALPADMHRYAVKQLTAFAGSAWRSPTKGKKVRWDMAILVNPDEITPPSDKKALKNFVKAAENVGIHAEIVSQLNPAEIGHYDALFIRETTAIEHSTYQLARAAEREGLIVMDDSSSILRCCNKVFLQDAFSYQNVPAPKSRFVSQADANACDKLVSELGLPLVLKLPESSFSRGVYKVESVTELQEKLTEMLGVSALVLVQEYIFTDYDWRIGVLGGKPIYACKYFMARNHWQIYHHDGDHTDSGDFVTMATFEVPRPVLQAAVKAAKVVGNGLYGVDIKQDGNNVFVIEVNDNPSIEAGIEDKYLGKALYEIIMQEFADRLEKRGK